MLAVVFQLWIQERLPMAMCQEHGSTLQEVQQLMKKNQVKEKNLFGPKYWYFLTLTIAFLLFLCLFYWNPLQSIEIRTHLVYQ